MDKYVIKGGCRLTGEVNISGAKNAAVAILPAVILSDSPCRIENIPDISDVKTLTYILKEMGARVEYLDLHTVEIDPRPIMTDTVSAEIARRIRASYYFIGALLGRCRNAVVPLPGGCNFGVRPIDQHLKGFVALGCDYSLDNGMISVSAQNDLHGANIYLDVVTVGATMNIMLAAVKARGLTVIENAAREPHIVDLANFLNTMGADIRGAGTDTIKIHGVQRLRGVTYSIIPDQIEAGTYMVAAAATGGDVVVKNVTPKHLESISAKLVEMGVTIEEGDDTVRVLCERPLRKCNVKTMPHPGFPTDMQPQITTLLSVAKGTSMVNESVWENNRFKYVDELRRMGAQITVDGKVAIVEGADRLKGAPVRALDLRAGAAMVIAGLVAEGTTQVEDVQYIERGYENIVEKLVELGADIYRMEEPERTLDKIG
ncbi:UDP-N-acetylglucosamine 1-carboxyvinyltransferase [Neglectibacter timonensis]|uniref:UDP-N-acetylglucosamine 1-carboxyvinyltransferase n=1 Tax=Neglectibacter timonensis TaxID=1776382 RepID=UPI00083265B7|nr:UDP-N-acetylglucosamine 1-carboxyvinyltransferase [Neglectibacter timonensis]MEE0729449.1 UDP-N-acetylglucosamine 1-carboxyvinyltransferase [Oscillospiraceae bacterium]